MDLRCSFGEPDKYADGNCNGLPSITWVHAPGRFDKPIEILSGPEHPIEREFNAPRITSFEAIDGL